MIIPRRGQAIAMLVAELTFIRADVAPLADADSSRKQVNF